MKITYEVTVHVQKVKELDWVTWMTEIHMPSICEKASVSDAILIKSDETEVENASKFRVTYLFNDKEALDDYLENYAQQYREEHQQKFGEYVSVSRSVGILLKWFETNQEA